MLVTNIVTLVLIVTLLTVAPMIPSIVVSRYLAYGLAKERAHLGRRTDLATTKQS